VAKRIVIIDNDENIGTTPRLTLEFKGFDVTEATSGEERPGLLRDSAFDLVFRGTFRHARPRSSAAFTPPKPELVVSMLRPGIL
jgi:hypothetical protein